MIGLVSAWAGGVVLGLGVAAPFGPINVEIVRRHLSRGVRSGLLLGLGACSVDTGYILLISFGLITARPGQRVQAGFMLTGAAILTVLAGLILRKAGASARTAVGMAGADPTAGSGPGGSWRDYTVGVMMTAASPMNLVFWLGVIASGQYLDQTPWGPWPRIVGVMCGTTGWVLALNGGLLAGRRLLRPWLLVLINVAGAAILVGFAVRGAWQALIIMGK